MNEQNVTVSLTRAEAIVFVTILMRFRDEDRFAVEHEAEQQLLWDLCCVVENQVGRELLSPEWNNLLDQARLAVLDDKSM